MIELIITSSALILVIVALRYILKGKISLRLQYSLWALILVRLLMPISLGESRVSLMSMVEQSVVFEMAEHTLSETRVYSDSIRNSEMTADEAQKVGTGTLHEIQGYSIESGNGHLHNYIFMDSLGTVLARLLKPLWLIGIATVGLCMTISNLIFARKLRKVRKRLHMDNFGLAVYEVEALPTPCLFGLFSPAIYITPDVAEDETKLRHVLVHEGIHYRHKDHIWSALRVVCLALHWYNPLVWLAAMLSRRDGELACDEATIKIIGEDERIKYGRTLVGLTCERRSALDLLSCATTMTDGKAGIHERITLIAKKPKMLISALIAVLLIVAVAVGCTFTGADNEVEETEPGIVQLTEEEIELANKALSPLLFDDNGEAIGVNPRSHFFKCFYDRPEDIDLAEFLRYLPSGTVADEAEFDAIKAHENFPFGEEATLDRMSVPTHRITAKSVNELLLKYTGITLDDLSGVGAEDVLYLAEYDSYYNFTSDFGAGTFNCTHGEREGGVLRLYDSDRILLTLKMQGDDYLIVSFQRLGEEADTEPEKEGADSSNNSGIKKDDLKDFRTIGQVPTVYIREENMGYNEVLKVAELLMTELLEDLKTEQGGRSFTIIDWSNLSVSADRMYDAWVVTGDVDVRYEGLLSPIGDSGSVPEGEYVNVSIGERYLRHEDGVYTLSLQSGTLKAELELPVLFPDMNVGIGAIVDYADDNILVFHWYAGLVVYDLDEERITFAADLKKAVGTTVIQGSEGAAVRVSDDGSTIQLFFYSQNQTPKMAYRIDSRSGDYEYGEFTPLDSYFLPTDEMYTRISFGRLDELTYTDSNESWLIFENWPWAE